MAEALALHEDPRSGNCYKIRLTAALLGLPLERRFYDIMKGETRTPAFLAEVNANGRILNEHTWLVRGYLSFQTAIDSELIFDDLVERMRDAVRVDGSLGLPGLLGSGLSEERGVQVASAGPVLFAGLLCHSAALELKTRNWAEWRKP